MNVRTFGEADMSLWAGRGEVGEPGFELTNQEEEAQQGKRQWKERQKEDGEEGEEGREVDGWDEEKQEENGDMTKNIKHSIEKWNGKKKHNNKKEKKEK